MDKTVDVVTHIFSYIKEKIGFLNNFRWIVFPFILIFSIVSMEGGG